jgi:hypothetical protein
MGRFCVARHAGAMGTWACCFARRRDATHEQCPRRTLVSSCGQLPMDSPQRHMPYRVPDAASVPDAAWRLSLRHAGLRSDRASSWRVLRRLLLGAHGAVVGSDEPALDGPTRIARFVGEGHFHGPPDRCFWWHSPRRGRRLVIVNGNAVMASRPEGGAGLL